MSPSAPLTVTIVGAGYAGIAQAVQLKRRLGERVRVRVVEKADGPGGIWKTSTWPGAGVDIPIHLYSLYSDTVGDWKNVFAEQKDVLSYLEGLIQKHNIASWFEYNTSYVSSTWDPTTQQHTITLQPLNGTTYTVKSNILISANGPLSTPQIPNIPGLDSFKGDYFHNLRWRSDLDYSGKKIAVVGNGSSGIQFIPGLAELPGTEVVQYIRSGGYFFPKKNTPFSEWDKFVFTWVPGARWLHRTKLFIESDRRWTARNDSKAEGHDELEQGLLKYLTDNAPAEHLDKLIPKYPLGCKRPAFDAGWLAALHRPNVDLRNSPIDRIEDGTLYTKDGSAFKPDIIIFATGSDVARHGVGLNVGLHGEGGKELKTYWEEIGGPQSFRGLAVPGFPNVFHVIGPNAIAGTWGWTIGNQTTVIARLIKDMYTYGVGALQPKQAAFELENEAHQAKLSSSTMVSSLCSNWWRIEGKGRVSVPNSRNAVEQWRATRSTDWTDWLAEGRTAGAGEKAQVVDVRRKVQRRRAAQAAGVAALLGAAWYLTDPRVAKFVEKLRA